MGLNEVVGGTYFLKINLGVNPTPPINHFPSAPMKKEYIEAHRVEK